MMAEMPVLERLTASDLFLCTRTTPAGPATLAGSPFPTAPASRLCLLPPIAITSRDCYSSPWARRPSEEADDGLGEVGRM